MTRKELLDLMERTFSKGLHAAIIAFRNPLTETIEARTMYSDEFCEVRLWVDHNLSVYKELKLPYAVWVNDCLEDSWGELILETDCIDE